MLSQKISRRAAMLGGGAILAWSASPASAFLQKAAATMGRATRASIDELIKRMTLEEKAGQLTLMASAWGGGIATALNPPTENQGFPKQIEDAVQGKLTGVFNGNGAAMALQMQRAVMSRSRMKIPLIFAADVIHGHRTIFPVGVGEAASFEPSLAERTARVAAFEAAGSGIDWTFAPMVDISRDQRWGRTMEGSGEDVILGMIFAAARVKGFQGRSLADDDCLLATIKHFAAYGAAESGLDYNPVDLSERTLREVYLRPYKAGIDAGAATVMSSFNEISGIPANGNHWLQTEVLRGEWGFKGFIVSDYTGDEEMIVAGYAADRRDAARIAFLAGVDMSMQSGVYAEHLPGLVRDGLVPEAKVDESVRRVLAAKSAVGLFDDPFRRIDLQREKARSRLPNAIALARESAQKSIVMVKNEGNLLPLSPSAKIALIGPMVRSGADINGPWVVYGDNAQAVDLPAGIREAVKGKGSVTVTQGSGIDQPLNGGIAAAVAAARKADVVLLAVGESERMSGEAQSRTDITIPPAQQELAEAVARTGKPIVVILRNGRALALKGAIKNAPAILVTWFLGSESGHATADILFGKVGPSGRLPISFPHESGQQPYYYAHKATGRANPPGPPQEYKTHFRETLNEALYPFGHGLTYGVVVYGSLALSTPRMGWDDKLTISTTLTNRGKRAATEVAQLYIHDRVASITRPVREMRAFQKVDLAPGESKTVRFVLSRRDLEFVGVNNRWIAEPGAFDVWIAPSAQAEGARGSFVLAAA
ncbi:glycoside hydrolase family 3 C-terminal domain-containing protein [Sphingomonas rhizophila]|uniref:beta-glucosidase n=1 Tax=Sphingomonas rhizophila TaxID=2071607 RepID=A0A7G9S9Y5_9SPHN|nr:glycoside hydrolase family 3 N-terminal domain-containing protein [Sphingomonas rhizophila]QNN64660.1 glycoside hydrolase family 3 C-terminal domain-containing protein [Sphingomonas rhizophila]